MSAELLLALDACAPGEFVSTLRQALADRLGAGDVELLVVDHGLHVLRSLDAPEAISVPVAGSVAGRAFTRQQLTAGGVDEEGVLVYVPVTVRGQRQGVLRMRLAAPPDPALRAEVAGLATVIGHALAAAARETDVVEQAARIQPLSLPAEMQWQLLPGRGCAAPRFSVAGYLQQGSPICGDAYDWAAGPDDLQLAVVDGTGEGTAAAMLTHLALTAVRNARRAGAALADQARLADQAVYAQHRGEVMVSTLLLRLDLAEGRMAAVDAGSPKLFRQRPDSGELEPIGLDPQLPLGMFEGTPYVEQEVPAEPGDRFLVVTDGGHADAAGLAKVGRETRAAPPAEAMRSISGWLRARDRGTTEGGEPIDDAVVVCLDWIG